MRNPGVDNLVVLSVAVVLLATYCSVSFGGLTVAAAAAYGAALVFTVAVAGVFKVLG